MSRILALTLAFVCGLAFAEPEVVELPTRPGVTLRFLYAPVQNPAASAVLFQGGTGNIGLFPSGSIRNRGFLADGAAARFNANGISVAVVDVPSDRRTLEMFRHTPEHAQDIAAVVAYLRQRSPVPVWAIGTSNGSLSAASAAEFLGERGPDGIVLTSSVTNNPRPGGSPVTDAALERITVPTLFVHHRYDACGLTPYGAIAAVMASMKKAKKTDLITIEGGQDASPACNTGHHQYLGIESDVTAQIAEWIKRNQVKATGG